MADADFEYVSQVGVDASDGPKPAKDFTHYFSRVTLARKESSIKKFYKYFMIPGLENLAGGMST